MVVGAVAGGGDPRCEAACNFHSYGRELAEAGRRRSRWRAGPGGGMSLSGGSAWLDISPRWLKRLGAK